MIINTMCRLREESVMVFAVLVGLQYLTEALPLLSTAPLDDRTEANVHEYHAHRWRGERVKIQCDARMAGFELSKVKVVWALHLQRMSDSGCNPRDPVMTLAELEHVNSNSEADQIYSAINGVPGWTVHAEGARLDLKLSNAQSAWVGVSIDQARAEDSGTYRCDALVGEVDGSLPKQFMSSYTIVTVSGPDKSVPDFSHVTMEESVASIDYDSTVIGPLQNHRRVGQLVNITCAPRLLRQLPTLPFSVSLLHIRFLPFRLPGSRFLTVAQYSPEYNEFVSNPPEDRMWEFSHDGIHPSFDRNMDSLHLRINIGILNATVEDTGIFDCAVTEAATGNTYHAEAGLKVSDDPQVQAGYCDPLRPEQDGLFHFEEDEASTEDELESIGLGLETGAKTEGEQLASSNSDVMCLAALVLMVLALLLLLWLARKQILSACGCAKKEEPPPSPPPPPPPPEVEPEKEPVEPAPKPEEEKGEGKDNKKKKKDKNDKEEPAVQPEGVTFEDDDAFSPFTSYHFDYLRDWLYEEPCIPLVNTNIQLE